MATVNTLYRVKNSQVKTVLDSVPVQLVGASVSIDIVGSRTKPSSLSEMTTIGPFVDDAALIESEGWYNFSSLPYYIAFVGTADAIEVDNVQMKELGANFSPVDPESMQFINDTIEPTIILEPNKLW